MKQFFIFILLALLTLSCSKQVVTSPDLSLCVHFRLTETGAPQYRVQQHNAVVIDWSDLGLKAEDVDLSDRFKLLSYQTKAVSNHWETTWGEERFIVDNHNEYIVHLRHSSGILMDLIFRAFNDGFAFRYAFPKQQQQELTIIDERTSYHFTTDPQAWSIPWNTEYYEGIWTKDFLSRKQDTLSSPITLEMANGRYAFVHEAALYDYPAQNLYMNEGALRTYLTPWCDGNGDRLEAKGYCPLPFDTPWRFVILAHNLQELTASRIMLNLNEPCKIEDTSWIKPMKFIGIWWGMHMKYMTWEQGPKHGATTKNMERYLRFAKDHQIEAVLAEGWNLGWEDWKHFSFTKPYNDWDMDYLTRLAQDLDVQIIGHNETGGNAADYEDQLEEAYAYHQKHGIHAIKTGYVSPIIRTVDGLQYNKSQSGVRHYRKVIETAARYQICIDNHEPVMPTGLQRTYPNLMTQEAVRGQEWNAWSKDGGNPAFHVTVLPFTRIMAGPVDFTPGVFAFENHSMPGTRVRSTLMNQLGLFVCLYSPLQMACDLPENYMKHADAFRFIENVPCDWEQSLLIDGQIGEFCIFARQKRGAEDWYIGGINAEEGREVAVSLSMLDAGTTYHATVYRDGEKADWKTNPYDYLIEERTVTAKDTLLLRMASGGGFAIEIEEDLLANNRSSKAR